MKIAISLSMILFSLHFLQAQTSELNWQKNTIITDGNNTDWMERPGFFNGESGVLYEAYNDSNNLYLLFEITDQNTKIKTMTAGFNIEISVKSKPKVNAAIYMPVLKGKEAFKDNNSSNPKNKNGMGNQPQKKGQKPDFRNDYQLLNSYAEVLGFIDNPQAIYPSDSINGFTYNYGWDKKEAMLFEFCIPLHHLFGEDYNLIKISKAEITIKPEFKAIEKPDRGNMGAQGSMMTRGGGMQGGGMQGAGMQGGRSGGGRPGGMGGQQGGMGEMQGLLSTHSFKYKVKLATPPNHD